MGQRMSDPLVRITDGLQKSIELQFCGFAPRRSGALIKTAGLIHALIEGTRGGYCESQCDTADCLAEAQYVPPAQEDGQFAGFVRFHPEGTPDPSMHDLDTASLKLNANPGLQDLWLFVVSGGEAREFDVALLEGAYRMSIHLVTLCLDGTASIVRAKPVVIPIAKDLQFAGLDPHARGTSLRVGDQDLLAFWFDSSQNPKRYVVGFCYNYPHAAPVVASFQNDEIDVVRTVSWYSSKPSSQQLKSVLSTFLANRRGVIYDRVNPFAGDLSSGKVLIAGLGSTGSQILGDLARVGVANFILIDPDIVEESDLINTSYRLLDVGLDKIAAATDLLRSVNPIGKVNGFRLAVQQVPELAQLCSEADLVLALTNDPNAQALLSRVAYGVGTPMISVRLYLNADAGEVVLCDPKRNDPCLACNLGGTLVDKRMNHNRLTKDLDASQALGPSIHLVCEQASIVAIGMLANEHTPAAKLTKKLQSSGRTLGIIATTPEWDFFPEVFKQTRRHQFAPQSVWLTTERDPNCSVCGELDDKTLSLPAKSAATNIIQMKPAIKVEQY